jgi:hypothetical protein
LSLQNQSETSYACPVFNISQRQLGQVMQKNDRTQRWVVRFPWYLEELLPQNKIPPSRKNRDTGGATPAMRVSFCRPYGTGSELWVADPRLAPWAELFRPCGAAFVARSAGFTFAEFTAFWK